MQKYESSALAYKAKIAATKPPRTHRREAKHHGYPAERRSRKTDETGNFRFLRGFSINIGHCSILEAGLWAIIHGLKMAREMGVRNILLEADSRVAIGLVKGEFKQNLHVQQLVDVIRSFMAQDWVIKVSHIHMEANRVADRLAALGIEQQVKVRHYKEAHIEVMDCLRDDIAGVSIPRLIGV